MMLIIDAVAAVTVNSLLIQQAMSDIQSQLQGSYYGLVYLGLATLAYASGNTPSQILPSITNILVDPAQFPLLPDPNNPSQVVQGYWKLDWLAQTPANANLVFIVSYRLGAKPAQGDGPPQFFAVVNRGTVTSAGPLGVATQIAEDLLAYARTPWAHVLAGLPNPNNNPISANPAAQISSGTALAMALVTHATSALDGGANMNLAQAMISLQSQYSNTPTIITGHSLGGCLTQVIAAYLAWAVFDSDFTKSATILPNPFAPPSPGNPAFVAQYESLFPNGNFWYNTLDLAPCAWANLDEVHHLWSAYEWPAPVAAGTKGPACNTALAVSASLLAADIKLRSLYTRTGANVRALAGSLPTPETITDFLNSLSKRSGNKPPPAWDSWTAQVLWQHFPPCYHQLVQSQTPGVAPFPDISQVINA